MAEALLIGLLVGIEREADQVERHAGLRDFITIAMAGGKLQAVRPVYAGKATASVDFSSDIQVATTRPNVFTATPSAKAGTVENLAAPADGFKAIVKEILAKAGGKVDLT